jgi:hypothetical protein
MTLDETRCPLCGAVIGYAPPECPQCRQDLSGFWRMTLRSWRLYNRALARQAAGETAAAAREAYAATVLAPACAEFHVLLAQLLAKCGELDEAVIAAHRAAELASGSTADALLKELLEQKLSLLAKDT